MPADDEPYSVPLFYPNYANNGSAETYYASVRAANARGAAVETKRQAAEALEGAKIEPDDFATLLVTRDHHYGEPAFDV